METVDVLIIGGGTAATNAARRAMRAGADRVVLVHPKRLTNTCVEEGCMPSKSLLAGAHQGDSLAALQDTRNTHIARLKRALEEGFSSDELEIIHGEATFLSPNEVSVQTASEAVTTIKAGSIVIATGSTPFVPPIPGLDINHERVWISDDVVSAKGNIPTVPKRLLTIGAGPIGLELSTVFHDLGSEVVVLQRGQLLGAYDPEFGDERARAAADPDSFPIHLATNLTAVEMADEGAKCTIEQDGVPRTELFDAILVATGRSPQTKALALAAAGVETNERGGILVNDEMQTNVSHIYAAGDVIGHHQILHYAAEMGKVAGHNAADSVERQTMDYDKHMLAVSFDQFSSALIGLTEAEATKRGIAVNTAVRHFNSIGLGILKRQEYGLWKLVAEAETGRVIGAQILGPDSAGELIQTLVPIIANQNTVSDIVNMTWYHPTYAEILLSLARDIAQRQDTFSPGI